MKKISLCVPSYNRPDTLSQLINSFVNQKYKNKELVISDDSTTDEIKNIVRQYSLPEIKYSHNKPNLGLAKNLFKSMENASGDYLIILGDDDVLLNAGVLGEYVKIFEKYPKVDFIYSNLVQFSEKLAIETSINFSKEDKYFKKGEDSMKNIWIRSIFIGGMGFRNSKKIRDMYPMKKILHPQMELVGNIINNGDSYLTEKHNIGFRSHNNQIIFHALKDKKFRQEGEHMVVEIHSIFEKLKSKYNLSLDFDFFAKLVIDLQFIMTFKEKMNLGTKIMEENYKKFCDLSQVAKDSKKLRLAYLLSKYLPSFLIYMLRKCAILLVQIIRFKENKIHKRSLDTIIQ